MLEKTCVGCKYLYSEGTGYSNWTWDDNEVRCAKNLNPNLPAEEGFDWKKHPDNWSATKKSRCTDFSPGVMVCLDVDGEDSPGDYTDDKDAIEAICAHSGRKSLGK